MNQSARTIVYPVVLKGENIAHKTEAGAVALDIKCAEELGNVASRMNAETYLVEEMIAGAIAEMLIGIVADPAHGFVLTIAAGGTLTELILTWNVSFVARFSESLPIPLITVGETWAELVPLIAERMSTDDGLVTCVDSVAAASASLDEQMPLNPSPPN